MTTKQLNIHCVMDHIVQNLSLLKYTKDDSKNKYLNVSDMLGDCDSFIKSHLSRLEINSITHSGN